MITTDTGGHRFKFAVWLKAIVFGLLMAAVPANVWLVLVVKFPVPIAAAVEAIFLGLYLWWAAGGGAPRTTQAARASAFRRGSLRPEQWFWGIVAAVFFAVTVHASLFLLFRFVPFPAAAFRQGYDLSFIPSLPLKWLAVMVSAVSAAVCEETGFRGYLQRPLEQRHGVPIAILASSVFFMALHLTKAWALVGMIPIVFGAGVLLGLLAWSSRSLIPGMIGHAMMDVGLFAFWWTGIAGDFSERPVAETGLDHAFLIACAVLVGALFVVLLAIGRLRRLAAFA